MRKLAVAMMVVVGSTVAGMSAEAGPPERPEDVKPAIVFPDFENGFVVFSNTTREMVCTPDQINFEIAFLQWFFADPPNAFAYFEFEGTDQEFVDAGGVLPPADPPPFEGIDAVRLQEKETGKGAIVRTVKGSNLYTEVFALDENATGIAGPCTDTQNYLDLEDEPELLYTGLSRASSNDNNQFDSPSRNTSFGNRIRASLTDVETGEEVTYVSRFHLNFRCNVPDMAPPACLIERSSLR